MHELLCYDTQVSDFSPLEGMPLTDVCFNPKSITKGIDVIRRMKSLKRIGYGYQESNYLPPADFWKKYDAGEFKK